MFARSKYVWLLCFLLTTTFSDGKLRNSSVQPVKKNKADQSFVVNNNCGLGRGDREMMKYIKDKVDYIAERSTGTRIVVTFKICSIYETFIDAVWETLPL